MDDILTLIQDKGAYFALPIIIAFFTQGLKQRIPFFKTTLGVRLIHFLPMILGCLGGLLLPEETWQAKVLIGGALGSLSSVLYKIVTVTLANKVKLEQKIARESIAPVDIEE